MQSTLPYSQANEAIPGLLQYDSLASIYEVEEDRNREGRRATQWYIYDYMLLSCYNQKLQSIYRFEYLRSLVTKDKEIINKNTQRYLCGPSRVTDTDARFQSQRPDGGNLTKLKVYQVIFYCCHFWNCENISAWSWMF